MKKIVSLVLCLVMLLSLGSVVIAANEATPTSEAASGKLMFATHSTMGIMVDGMLEPYMHMNQIAESGKAVFGAAWDKDNLYIGMSGLVVGLRKTWQTEALSGMNATLVPLATATVTIGDKTYSTVEGAAGNAEVAVKESEEIITASATMEGSFYVEFGIPFSDLEVKELEDGTAVLENVKLSYNGADGENVFEGTLVISDMRVIAKEDIAGDSTNGQGIRIGSDYWMGEAGARTRVTTSQLVCKVAGVGVKAMNANYGDYPIAVEAYASSTSTDSKIYHPLKNCTSTGYLYTTASTNELVTAVQEDLYITGLPVADLTTIVPEVSTATAENTSSLWLDSNENNCARVLLVVGWGTGARANTSVGYVIYNTEDGLVLYDDLAKNSIPLGVNLGEWFNIRFELTPQKDAKVYVNGEYLAEMPASTNEKAFVNGHGYDNGFATSVTAGNTKTGKPSSAEVHVRNPLVANQKADATAALNKVLGKVITEAPTEAPTQPADPSGNGTPSDPTDATGTTEPDTTEKKGCGSSIAGGAIALICTVSLAGVALKKRKH